MKRTPEQLAELYAKFDDDMATKSRWYRFVLSVDQMFNVLLLNGSMDETISSHIHRKQESGRSTKALDILCRFLSKLEKNHCYKSRGE